MRHAPIFIAIIVLLLAGLLGGCKSDQTSATTGESVISGYIIDGSSNARLQGVGITAMTVYGESQTATSDANGMYTLKFTVDSTVSVTLTLKKTGYRDTSVVAQLKSGVVITQNLTLSPVSVVSGGGGVGGGSGLAQTIFYIRPVGAQVQVYGVGGKETEILSWEVRDSLGLPIDETHAVDLTFSLSGGPNGGEYLSPVVLRTNAAGQAHMTFNAGIKAGVVQVTATATVNGRVITSGPVKVMITGGFPDQSHFTLGALKYNFPCWGVFGMRLPISVLIGDKYSNPCSPSAVYFRTTAGVIQGGFLGVVTSQDGQGTVDLISGNPVPTGQYSAGGYGDGYHRIYARTIGEGGQSVQDSIVILWSGPGVISGINPTSFDVLNGLSQQIDFQVSDALGHPLAAGTKISVTATIPPPMFPDAKQNQVQVQFGNQGVVELPDLIMPGPGSTQFTLWIKDGSWGLDEATPVNLTITVTGPNTPNQLATTIGGLVH